MTKTGGRSEGYTVSEGVGRRFNLLNEKGNTEAGTNFRLDQVQAFVQAADNGETVDNIGVLRQILEDQKTNTVISGPHTTYG